MKSFILTAALLLTNVIVMAQVTRSNQLSKKTDMNTNDKTASEKPDDVTLRSKLTAEQYAVTQQNATERAFKNEYWNEKREGIYVDITTGEPLFISTDKFDSGCGWPSFSKPIDKSLIMEKSDKSYGMNRRYAAKQETHTWDMCSMTALSPKEDYVIVSTAPP